MRFLERGAASDLWRNTLSHIPTLFGRLVYLASLRNPNSGVYQHHGMALLYGDEEADKALRESHAKVFGEWLRAGLEIQKADLDGYLSGLVENKPVVIDTWMKLMPHRNLVPLTASQADRLLFVDDFETLLRVLKEMSVKDGSRGA